ncbi:Phosphoadenylyl-sulfate reductase [thioredoxin] [uncultured Candidatus Thioglobus sp.]|nr:Phosphoadenylyl-sulfate reductase [thioredoxin] [uncultured Candidatus Thioglobus sp.]
MAKKIRHVLGISGGKDSAALAIYLKQQNKIPGMEYFFTDTGVELPEIYIFLDKLEIYLGKKITRLGSKKDFFHHLKMKNGMLPSPQQRWCTKDMKIVPFEEFIGDDECVSYIGIRADENREGYISRKKNIKPAFPFIEDGLIREDIFNLLRETVGIPEYYEWRSRSGCFFCFFQRREEWLGLAERHPKEFARAIEIEKQEGGKGYTWIDGMTLEELLERKDEILANSAKRKAQNKKDTRSWQDILIEDGQDDENQACTICSL